MTIQESYRVLIGSTGWQHENWNQSFYPEDLPADWQLAFYGNEFPVVMIRDREWLQGEPGEWLDETDELPMFICEVPLQQTTSDWLQVADGYLDKIKQLGERCIAIVCTVNGETPPDVIQTLLEKCRQLAPTCFNPTGQVSTELEQVVKDNEVNLVMTPGEVEHCYNDDVLIAMMDSAKADLKTVRQSLESLLAYQGKINLLVLLFTGDSPDLEMTRQAKVILELL